MLCKIAVVSLLSLGSPAHARGDHNYPTAAVRDAPAFVSQAMKAATKVIASFYGHAERLNRYTSTGEVFDPMAMTCAHRTLPFGTKLQVTYGDQTVAVRVNDRGPAAWTGRSLDLSYGAALKLGMVPHGAGPVVIAIAN
jgi:rare lipoprotein A (peptidoglycan hydrolase)